MDNKRPALRTNLTRAEIRELKHQAVREDTSVTELISIAIRERYFNGNSTRRGGTVDGNSNQPKQ